MVLLSVKVRKTLHNY